MSWRALGSGRSGAVVWCWTMAVCASLGGARDAAGQARGLSVGTGVAAISNGIGQLARRDVPGATREFQRAADDSNAAVRSAGEKWLGHVSWMIHADALAASRHLDRALTGTNDTSGVNVERARLLGFQHRFREAARVALTAMRTGADAERRGAAARTLVDVTVDGAFVAIAAKGRPGDSLDVPSVREALDTLRTRVSRFPGRTADARALLNAAALLHDRDAMRAASASYFRLMHDSIGRVTGRESEKLSAAAWGDDVAAASTLAAHRLYESLALLAVQPGTDSRLADAATYGLFLHRLRVSTNAFYRRALLGRVRGGDLDRTLNAATRALWTTLYWPEGTPQYYPAAVPRELRKRFSTIMSIERDAIPELRLAHAIDALVAPAPANSGRKSELIVVLDEVVSDGVDFWLLDGAAGRAGWVAGDSVFEVRQSFTETPYRTWMVLTDPQLAATELFRVHRDSIDDIARAGVDSAGFLPGVAARVFRAGASAVLDSLAHASITGVDEEIAFVEILFRELVGSTIVLHETRHLTDAPRHSATQTLDVDGEFRAKIDEVRGARRPKLAMTAILSPNIGDQSAHGQANRRVMLGLIRWIRSHVVEIGGYVASLPPLTQLPLLTDDQLRAAFQSMRGKD